MAKCDGGNPLLQRAAVTLISQITKIGEQKQYSRR